MISCHLELFWLFYMDTPELEFPRVLANVDFTTNCLQLVRYQMIRMFDFFGKYICELLPDFYDLFWIL